MVPKKAFTLKVLIPEGHYSLDFYPERSLFRIKTLGNKKSSE